MQKLVFPLAAFLLLLSMALPSTTFAKSNMGTSNAKKAQLGNAESNHLSATPDNLTPKSSMDLTQYVDPFIGTGVGAKDYGTGGGGANLFPGADVPFGMMQWSPDTNKQTQGGYKYEDKSIEGFSVNHLSGAGGPGYGDIPFMPIAGSVDKSPATHADDYKTKFSHDNESASPGYYQVKLDSGIDTQLTVNQRSGIGKFTYPSDKQASMLINTSGSSNGVDDSHVKVTGDHQVEGSATGGQFYSGKHTVYFIAKFDHAFKKHGTWKDSNVNEGSDKSDGKKSGAYVTFDKGQDVKMKVGISYVSIENAEENLDKEIPDWDFQKIKDEADQAWNQRLNRIQVSGGTDDQKKIFYTALYHSLLHPNVFSDINGEYIGFDDKVHKSKKHEQYANFSSWDIYRSEYQLLSILAPDETSDMNQSQLNDAKQGGGAFPIWGVANDDAHVMIGDSSDIMIASGYAFGADNFDLQEALKYMVKGATDTSVHSKSGVTRYGLKQYLDKGYEEPSTTLEYTSDDFSIAQFAKSLGDTDNYEKFMKRSQNWQKLFNPETGFIQPKHENGAFVQNFNPKSNAHYMESNGYQYAWMVPYNLEGLFNAMGGKNTAVKRLDKFFTKLNDGQTGTEYAFLGNEPSLEVPWEYNFAGAPWKTQKVVRRAITKLYDTTPGGMAGNDDLGEMSSWYVFGAMGLYPEIPGVAGFTIGSPLFSDIKLNLKDGHQLHIKAPEASEDKPYVQNLQLNGKDYDSTWLPFDKVMSYDTANLDFDLGKDPNKDWASGSKGLSPSFTEGQEPVIGSLSKSEVSVKKPDYETTVQLGVHNITSKTRKIDWKAEVPDGFELSKKSGAISVDAMGSKTTDLKVKVPGDIDNGTYVIPIQLNEGSEQLTPTALQIDVEYGDVTGEIESIHADENNPPYEIDSNLIDGNIGTKWLSHKDTAKITMKLSKPEAVAKYSLTSANDFPKRDPKDWTFYGSQDGKDWTKLDSQSGAEFNGRHQRNTFRFKNDDKYTYYRLDITKNAGGVDTQLTGIALSTQYHNIRGGITDEVESIHADGNNPPNEIDSNLIDGNIGTKWLSGKNTAKITMKLSKPEAVIKYGFTSANDFPGRDPEDWTLYGSKDGKDWTKLDSQSGVEFGGRHQRNIYKFKNVDKYSYYRFDITKNAGEKDTQLAEINLATNSYKDKTPPEIETKMNGESISDKEILPDAKTAKFTWDASDEISGIDRVSATFDGITYGEGTEIDLAGKTGKHELVVTAVDNAGNTKEKTYVIKVTTSTDSMKKLVKRYEKDGSIKQGAAHLLNLQLTTIDLFEKKDAADKVEKHLKGLDVLLQHQKNNHSISDKVYKVLKADTDYLLKK